MPQQAIYRLSALLTFLILLYSCFPTATSTIVGGQYEEKTNTTEYFVLPYGSITLPGRWIKTKYNPNSRQQFFKNVDTVTAAIAFGPCNKYEFYKPELKNYQFVNALYEWESKFYADQLKLTSKILYTDSTSNFIIWRLWGGDSIDIDTYFLHGYQNCSVHNYSVTSNKWTEDQKTKFLQDLYLRKK